MSSTSATNPQKEVLPPELILQAAAAVETAQVEDAPARARAASRSQKDRDELLDPKRPRPPLRRQTTLKPTVVEEQEELGETPQPIFGEDHNEIDISQDGLNTHAKVSHDGRVNININQRSRKLSSLLVPALRSQLKLHADAENVAGVEADVGYIPPNLGGKPGQSRPPPLSVVIQIVGSRGDVQPFVALGKVLKRDYNYRIRIATHPTFKSFVEENDLEFFSIGGDPAELMAFMVKNPGLLPGFDSLKSGDVGKRRKGIYEILLGCWRSCYEPGDGMGVAPSGEYFEDSMSIDSGISLGANPAAKPFVADAIIANPPSFAHIHIAEKMGIPLHMMFTMPWSPTQAFPHPLANVQSSNADTTFTNFVSYALVDMMTWQGLGDVINRFRERTLGLEPVSLVWAPGMITRLRIPYTYCWSPALIPKPKDWGPQIDISGFFFLNLASAYTPDPELAAFLEAGPPPVYIGFGSIVVDDPNAMTTMIFEAIKKTGVRALVSKGWGGLGADELEIPESVHMLGNVPHDWLFKHVSCVVHHGGAGTTAAGISMGKPTVVVPFFGDQPFWGAMTAKAGAGPFPIAYKDLTADKLAASIMEALKPEALEKAKKLGESISKEKGADLGAKCFNDRLKVESLRCNFAPQYSAAWRIKRTNIRLSAFAANGLASEGLLNFGDLKLYRPREYEVEDGPWDPISGGASALLGTIGSLMMGVADFPVEIVKLVRDKKNEEKEREEKGETSSEKLPLDRTDSGHCRLCRRFSSHCKCHRKFRRTDSVDSGIATPDGSSTPPIGATGLEKESMDSDSGDSLHNNLTPDNISIPERVSTSGPSTPHVERSSTSGPSTPHVEHSSTSGPSSPHVERSSTGHSTTGHSTTGTNIPLETYISAGRGVSRIIGTGLKSPMDFTLSLAKGFRNAPKLYGDDTVRQSEKITDLQSGLIVAGKEFGYGMYDGISGLVTQPINGAMNEGVAGLIKGIGKGIGGVVLKPGAAIFGLPGYTFKGIYQEIQKHLGSSAINSVIAARTAQGYEEWKAASQAERLDVISRWHASKIDVQDQKHGIFTKEDQEPAHGFLATRHMSFDQRKKLAEERKQWKKEQKLKKAATASGESVPPGGSVGPTSNPSVHISSHEGEDDEQAITDEFEDAIQRSVTATSRGDIAEDNMIERAIRASVRELRAAHRVSKSNASTPASKVGSTNLTNNGTAVETGHKNVHVSKSEDDLRKAIEESKKEPVVDEDEELKKALEESKRLYEESQKKDTVTDKPKTEEEVVIDYIKKQSLAEAEHKENAGTS